MSSQLLINRFLAELDRLRTVSGRNRETIVSEAFKDLLKNSAKSHDLVFVPQYDFRTPAGNYRQVDGALVYSLRVPFGYWEAKDEDDDLDKEIDKKKRGGYPQDNIVFEDSRKAVLIQNRQEVARAPYEDPHALERLLDLFFAYERPEIVQFRKAVVQFKTDLPAVLEALRAKIEAASASNTAFKQAEKTFLDHVRDTINPAIAAADVREMLIQHILTEEIFAKVFDDGEFHRQNNIAKALYALEDKFFTGGAKRQMLKQLEPYYAAIRSAAAQISSHSEKQTFLKVVYENFYKVYNPKAADRLGVIYTPNEIVRFMIEGADWLCEKHFGKSLIDEGVEILDPATGTGTFICELLEHFRGQKKKLAYKYKEELHANEVAILPYYVANLNIEATYAAITGQFVEFPNLCFVDTLDNVAGLGKFSGHMDDLFGAMSEENVERIKRQNKRKISVIIGNPPYNAWQENYNSRNPNRPYQRVDERIGATYIREGKAQNKNSVYDMYTRFFRWASDRLKDDGIIAFISNRNFIEKAAYDGFRTCAAREFFELWLVDLGGDVRANPKISGTKNNVFGIQTGVTISFLVRRKNARGKCRIFYVRRPEFETAEDKLAFLATSRLELLDAEEIRPDVKANWLGQTNNDFGSLIPIASKGVKAGRSTAQDRAIFRLVSNGLKSQRDEWVYAFDNRGLTQRMRFFVETYERVRKHPDDADDGADAIKWDRELDRYRASGIAKKFRRSAIRRAAFRPFVAKWLYFDTHFNGMTYQMPSMFPTEEKNPTITFLCIASDNPLAALAVDRMFDLCMLKTGNGGTNMGVSRSRYTPDGARLDNITDWALEQFRAHYKKPKRAITKDAIFHYVYAVLHDPVYREKYAMNLKREFPRIPFYADFWRWAEWGESLMALHIGYEAIEPWPLARTDTKDEKAARAGLAPKTILKADKDHGVIVLDSETQLSGVPGGAWDYRLGNRSGLEWILDQYKEKTPKDRTIREKFNSYRFADHKETVIDLLMRVTRVSLETQEIVAAMQVLPRQ